MLPPQLAVSVDHDPDRFLRVVDEALTKDAENWLHDHALEFGELHEDTMAARRWRLRVYRGFEPSEVIAYLNELWDAQSWPAELEEEAKKK